MKRQTEARQIAEKAQTPCIEDTSRRKQRTDFVYYCRQYIKVRRKANE